MNLLILYLLNRLKSCSQKLVPDLCSKNVLEFSSIYPEHNSCRLYRPEIKMWAILRSRGFGGNSFARFWMRIIFLRVSIHEVSVKCWVFRFHFFELPKVYFQKCFLKAYSTWNFWNFRLRIQIEWFNEPNFRMCSRISL